MATTTVDERPREASAARTKRKESRFSFEARMLTPALLVLAALSIFPFIYLIVMSLSAVGLIGGISLDFVGLDNWSRLFTDEAVGASWVRSVVYFILTVGLEMVLGIAIALLVHELVWGKNIALSLILMPMFMAPVIVGLLGRFLTDSTYGLYAWVLKETGLYSGDILGDTDRRVPGGDADGRVAMDAADRADRARRPRLGPRADPRGGEGRRRDLPAAPAPHRAAHDRRA